jgi:hypothetical protein
MDPQTEKWFIDVVNVLSKFDVLTGEVLSDTN